MSKKTPRRPAHKQVNQQANTESADKYYQAGLALAEKGDFEGVIQQMTRAIQLSPELGRAYYRRGLAYYILGQQAQAINDLADSIDFNSSTIASFMDLGEMAGEDIMMQMAGPLLEEIYEACYEASLIFLELEDYKRALMALNQAVEIFGDEPEIFLQRGQIYQEMGQHAKALADYNRALRLEPNDPEFMFRRAMVYREMNQWDKALADLAVAEAGNPEWPQLYTERGVVYAGQGRWDDALAAFEKAGDVDAENSGVPLVLKAVVQAELGQTEAALENWQVVGVLNPLFAPPTEIEALRQIAKVYAAIKPAIEKLIIVLGSDNNATASGE